MLTAYSYIRFSTPEQLKGDSLRRQLEWSQDFAKKHRLVLDQSLKLRDLGVSAFKSRNMKQGALSAFLEAVEQGRVKAGSVLLIESLDRLSRDEIGEALELFLRILRKGIKIVTRFPEDEFSKASINDNVAKIMTAIIYMSRAHEESATKSKRIGEAWKTKRANIGEKKLTARIPAWLSLNEDRKGFTITREKAAIVKRIYRMAADGYGTTQIVKTLNAEGVESLARVKHWQVSYVLKILHNRAVLGEYQPCTGNRWHRKPIGDPVPHYYPAVIDEPLFYRVQAALTKRVRQRGPRGTGVRNLFTGILRNYDDGCAMQIVHKGKRSAGPSIVSAGAKRGQKGSVYVSFPYDVFEHAFLKWTTELKARDIVPASVQPTAIEDQLSEEKGKLTDINAKIAKAKKKMLGDGDFDSLTDVLVTLDGRKKEVQAKIDRLTADLHTSDDSSLSQTQELIEFLKTSNDPTDLRTRLKARIRTLITDIQITLKTEGQIKLAEVLVWFDGGASRHFWVLAKGMKNLPDPLPAKLQPHFVGNWLMASDGIKGLIPAGVLTPPRGTVDMRNPESVRVILEMLA